MLPDLSKHIEGLEKDKEQRLKDIDAELAALEDRNAPEAAKVKARERRESIVGAYDRQIERKKTELDQAIIDADRQAEETAKRLGDRAKATEEAMKRQARLSYIANGGSPESFEETWPELRNRLIAERVSREVNSSKSGITL